MNPKSFFKKFLFGLDLPNEYVCVSENLLTSPLNVFLRVGGKLYSVAKNHIFLGYRPLLLGLHFKIDDDLPNQIRSHPNTELTFVFTAAQSNIPHTVARLELKRLKEITLGENTFFLFEGIYGEHKFLNPFYRLTYFLRESMKAKNPANVDLPGNLYDQVRIAYSIPRNISIISLSVDRKYNLFPTDLHGAVGEKFYVGSLRHGGKACQQVEMQKKIVISKLETRYYKAAYALGKNHMSEPKGLDQFDVFPSPSEMWKLPLPKGVVSYRELQWMSSVDAGIHRIHFYESQNHKIIQPEAEVLSHIHQYYAKWRVAQGLRTDWLLR